MDRPVEVAIAVMDDALGLLGTVSLVARSGEDPAAVLGRVWPLCEALRAAQYAAYGVRVCPGCQGSWQPGHTCAAARARPVYGEVLVGGRVVAVVGERQCGQEAAEEQES